MAKYRFCYKISAEAGIAHDGKGNKAPAYIEASMDGKDGVDQHSLDRLHRSLVKGLHKDLGIPEEYIELISNDEYDRENGEED